MKLVVAVIFVMMGAIEYYRALFFSAALMKSYFRKRAFRANLTSLTS